MKKFRKIMVLLFIFSLVIGLVQNPNQNHTAFAASEYTCWYEPYGKNLSYCYCPDDAFVAIAKQGGGTICFLKDFELDFPDYIGYGYVNANTEIMVKKGVTLTIGEYGLHHDGIMNLYGTLDLQNSKGTLWGNGIVNTVYEDAVYKKREYEIVKNSNQALSAKNISFGEPLSASNISDEDIDWKASVPGKWQFVNQDYCPPVGSYTYNVQFVPDNTLMYPIYSFEKAGTITVDPVVPRMSECEELTVHYGENLVNYPPSCEGLHPKTGKKLEGEITYETENLVMDKLGIQNYAVAFIPKDSVNYKKVTQFVKVNVLSVRPEIRIAPIVRNKGYYGQKLSDIKFLQGKCNNPYTNQEIKGHWEWKDETERLIMGENQYSAVFVPDDTSYECVESDITVVTLPKEMEEIQWPSCSDIDYGESLADAALSFTKNEYGTFAWENSNICPSVKNEGGCLIFTPAKSDIYDWSKLDGYDEESKTLRSTIPIRVNPIKGTVPEVSADALIAGDSLSQSMLHCEDGVGKISWLYPSQTVKGSDQYDVLFQPEDRSNYDWSSYKRDEKGSIRLSVDVPVFSAANVEETGKIGQRLQEIALKTSEKDLTCEWGNPTQLLDKAGTVETSICYHYKDKSWNRIVQLEVEKRNQKAPQIISVIDASKVNLADGCILGVSDSMEYRRGTEEFTKVATGSAVVLGLETGSYEVRYRGNENFNPSESVKMEIGVQQQTIPTILPTDCATAPPTNTPEPSIVPDIPSTPEPSIVPDIPSTLEPSDVPVNTPTNIPAVTTSPTTMPTPTMSPTDLPETTVVPTPANEEQVLFSSRAESTVTPQTANLIDPEDYQPVIITKIASKLSTIVSNTSVAQTKIKKITRGVHRAKLSWSKVKGARYEIQVSKTGKWKKSKKYFVRKNTVKISNLQKKGKYYFRVRAYKIKNKKHIYGKWSKTKEVL